MQLYEAGVSPERMHLEHQCAGTYTLCSNTVYKVGNIVPAATFSVAPDLRSQASRLSTASSLIPTFAHPPVGL
jgi:hypothetical protein